MSEFNRSLSVGSETSLSPLPIKLTFICLNGTKATLILDKSFLTAYSLPFKDTDSLTVGALKQVIYDEWMSHLKSQKQNTTNTDNNNPSKVSSSSFVIPNSNSSISETKNENTQSQGIFTKNIPDDSNTNPTANNTELTFSNSQLNPTNLINNISASTVSTEWASDLANNAGQPPASPSHIRLIYYGRVLKDEDTLEDYKITASTDIYATLSPQAQHQVTESEDASAAINNNSSADSLKNHASERNEIQQQQQQQQQQLLTPPNFFIHLNVRPASLDGSTSKNVKTNKRRNKRRENSRNENNTQNSRRSSDSGDYEPSGRCCIIS